MPTVDLDEAALAHAHAAVGAADLVVVVAGDLALPQGLDDGEDGFAVGGVDDLPVQAHRHVGAGQRLDIECSA